MLKFKGNKAQFRKFMDSLADKFGASATIKEIINNIKGGI